MSTRNLVFIFILFLTANIYSQQIFFCEENSTNGEPIGSKSLWTTVGTEQIIYVLLKAGSEPIEGPIVYMFIDKSDEGQYYPYDSKAIKFEREKEFLVYRYKITESGKYSFYFQNAKEEEIAQAYVDVQLSGDTFGFVAPSNSLYYEGSNVTFCQVVIDGRPINKRSIQSLSAHGSFCYIYMNNFRPINTTKFIVYFYRRLPNSFEYDELVAAKKYRVSPEWEDAFFRYSFNETGDYKVIIYNENEMIMGNGYIRIVD